MEIRLLGANHIDLLREMLSVFAAAFEDEATYTANQPDDVYLRRLLASEGFIALGALQAGRVIGGLTAYVLTKMEQVRSEVYLYDLAVHQDFRRQGVATALIRAVQREGLARGAATVFVQAEYEDGPAVALYSKLGLRNDVLHFDIQADDEGT